MSEKTRAEIADEPPWRLSEFLLRWETILIGLLAAVFIGDMFLSPYFLDIYNLSDATSNFSEKAIIALGMALLILVREIDLSVAAIIALCSLAMGLASQAGAGTASLVLIGILVGAVCGSFNGFLVARIGLPSIVVTIGTMSLFRGIAQVALGDQAITQYPASFQALGQDYLIKWPPLHYSFALFLDLDRSLCADPASHRPGAQTLCDRKQSCRRTVFRNLRRAHKICALRPHRRALRRRRRPPHRAHRLDKAQHCSRLGA